MPIESFSDEDLEEFTAGILLTLTKDICPGSETIRSETKDCYLHDGKNKSK